MKCALGYQSTERTSIKLGITIRQVNKLKKSLQRKRKGRLYTWKQGSQICKL